MEFSIIICNIDTDLTDLINKHLGEFPINYYNGDFRRIDESFECIVSPGNSFGLMDGGVDAIIRSYFNDNFVVDIQTALLNETGGFHQPGGCVLIDVSNDDNNCKYLAHCPTMAVPMKIKHSVSVGSNYETIYYCIWNMLISIHKHNRKSSDKIKTVVCPCLGTGVGRLQYDYFIKLFKLALVNYINYLKLLQTDFTKTNNYCILSWEHATRTYSQLRKLIATFEEKKNTNLQDIMNSRRMLNEN